jgi:hypothetical protein
MSVAKYLSVGKLGHSVHSNDELIIYNWGIFFPTDCPELAISAIFPSVVVVILVDEDTRTSL